MLPGVESAKEGGEDVPPLAAQASGPCAFEIDAVSDPGTERHINEDHCAILVETTTSGIVVVADGVSSFEGGDTASKTAVTTLLDAYREPDPSTRAKRLYRAAQRANIAVFDLATVVPELRGMATTLTAVVIDHDELSTVHVGDCRLYLIRSGRIRQLTKDHTVVGERTRLGLLSRERARTHPKRSTLTRCMGRELIASVDRITTRVEQGDVLIVCSDGLYNVLADAEMQAIIRDRDARAACRALVEAANELGTPDNVTAGVVRIIGPGRTPAPRSKGILTALRWFSRR
jgi:serine/threonine protein phosphatase PrpC